MANVATLAADDIVKRSLAYRQALRRIESTPGSRVDVDLMDLDADDSESLAAVINAVRELCHGGGSLRLIRAPQMLCHNLYRVGLLEGPHAIELIDMREDEPSSG